MLRETLLKIKKSYFSLNEVTMDKSLEQTYQAGAEAEREACVKVCERAARNPSTDDAYMLSRQIRERKIT